MSSTRPLTATDIKEFDSFAEFVKNVDEEVAELRRRMGDLLKKLEELRIRVEQEKRIKEILGKLGVKAEVASNAVTLRGLTIVFNPTAEQEQAALEVAVESLNSKLTALQALRRELDVVAGTEIVSKIRVVYVDGIPKTVLFKL